MTTKWPRRDAAATLDGDLVHVSAETIGALSPEFAQKLREWRRTVDRRGGYCLTLDETPLDTGPLWSDAEFLRIADLTRQTIPCNDPDFTTRTNERESLLEQLGEERSSRVARHFMSIGRDSGSAIRWLATFGVVEAGPTVQQCIQSSDPYGRYGALSLWNRLLAWQTTTSGHGITLGDPSAEPGGRAS